MTTLYGLKNCDTCRKARKWLTEAGVEHQFHDVRADGLSTEHLQRWATQVDWNILLNKRGTTWRKLDAETQAQITDASSAIALMVEHEAILKRPVLEHNEQVHVGFKAADYAALFA